MDQRTPSSPDPSSSPARGERRRCVRQKLHTPVYASFNGPQTGMVVDLSELLDLDEQGFAVQTAAEGKERFEPHRAVTLCLDLPETRNFVHGSGEVIWSDDSGRVGIRFSFLPDQSRRILREWLFVNLLVASANHAARTEQLAHRESEDSFTWKFPDEEDAARDAFGSALRGHATHSEEPETTKQAAQPEGTSTAAREEPDGSIPVELRPEVGPTDHRLAVSATAEGSGAPASGLRNKEKLDRQTIFAALDEVRREVREITDSPDVIFQLIAERARTLTGTTGSAVAFVTDGTMICRARTGEPAPPVGSVVDVKQGLSGECVRTGLPVQCEDTGNDPRVDPELCRILGIGALLAVPVFADFRVVGLLEVLSSHPRSFTELHITILDRLAEMVPKTEPKKSESKVGPVAVEPLKREAVGEDLLRIEIPAEVWSAISDGVASGLVASEASENETAVKVPQELELKAERLTNLRGGRETVDEVPPLVSSNAPDPEASAVISVGAPDVEQVLTVPAGRSKVASLALTLSVVVVVTFALYYVLAPAIEKRLKSPAQVSQGALQTALETPTVAQAAWKGSGQKTNPLTVQDVRRLADQGNAEAQYDLGVLYHNGEGVVRDDAEAVNWYLHAANQGYVPAQSALGAYYEAGRGAPQDFSKAYFWSVLAVAQGDETSKIRLQDLSARMTRSQIVAARQLAESWLQARTQTAPKSN